MSDLEPASKLETSMGKLDLTSILKYTEKLNDISSGFNTMLAPTYIRDFIMAYDITNTILAKAMYHLGQADSMLKTAESVAYLDRAGDFLKEKKIKDTSEARKRYIPLDADVQKAEQIKARAEAMVSLLKNKLYEFRAAHEAVKKMAYSGDYGNSPNEGM